MSNIEELKKVPDITFIDGMTAEKCEELLKAKYEEQYYALTGEAANLQDGETVTMLIKATAILLGQGFQYVERAGKHDLLKYATGDALDNLGIIRSIERRGATAATCNLKFELSEPQANAVSIAVGTRVRAEAKNIYFETNVYAEIPAGEMSVVVPATCTSLGVDGNGIEIGKINRLVDTAGHEYIATVENVDVSLGGSDVETDDELTRRIYNAPGGYSVAGPEKAYVYHTLAARSDIGDVLVTTPSACKIKIYIMLEDGSIPSETVLNEVRDYLNAEERRPLTDDIEVATPSEQDYEISAEYYIDESDAGLAVSIQAAVTAAVEEYKTWQRHLGRDINPSELTYRMMAAGAKRVNILSPAFKRLQKHELAKLTNCNVQYMGLEEE